jgi:CRP-like cAMP-binding protein
MNSEMKIFNKLLSLAKCLKGFGSEDLRELLKVSSKEVWAEDELVFDEGSLGRDLYIICSGKVCVWRKNGGESVKLANLAEGESFGEMGLIRGGGRSAGASAVEETVALRVHYEKLILGTAAVTLLYRNIAQELAERLKVANDIIVFQSQIGMQPSPLMTIGKRHRSGKAIRE